MRHVQLQKVLLKLAKQHHVSSAMSSISSNKEHIDFLSRIFAAHHRPNFYENAIKSNSSVKKLRRAAVLVPISYDSATNGYQFTLTKRTDNLRTHKGEICFVGGMRDATDIDNQHTAYREAHEEIGLQERSLNFLAELVPICTTAGVLLTPIVAYFDKDSFEPHINKHEVDFIFDMSSKRFLSNAGHKSTKYINGKDQYYVHYFDDVIDGKKLKTWGATAFLSICVSATLNKQVPSFDVDPTEELKADNMSAFLEHYLMVKSARLIKFLASKTNL